MMAAGKGMCGVWLWTLTQGFTHKQQQRCPGPQSLPGFMQLVLIYFFGAGNRTLELTPAGQAPCCRAISWSLACFINV